MSKEITPEMVKDAAHHSNWEQYKLVYRKELANIECQARIDELLKLTFHQSTRLNGKDDIQVTLDYIANRLAELEREE